MTDKTFGTKRSDLVYREIQSAYVIALENGAVHVVYASDGSVTLPGATVTEGRSHEETILGACLDMTGYDVGVDDYVTDVDLYDDEQALHITQTYYSGSFIELIAPQKDPTLRHEMLALNGIEKLSPM